MSKIANLARARKLRARADAKQQADENSVKFGRSKAEKMLRALQTTKARRMLDAHKMDDE
jgi:hypothetical protein